MQKYRIAWLPGDGIGVEVLDAAEIALINKSLTKEFPILPLPKSQPAIIDAGGLIPYTRTRLVEKSPATAETGAQRSLVNLTTPTV